MNQRLSRLAQPWGHVSSALVALALAGCEPPCDCVDPATEVSGVVIDGAIQGATVCLDLNKNGACDANEPASAATDSKGTYRIAATVDQIGAAPLVAMVPATAVDASNPTETVGKAFTLSAPAGRGAVISPITTLIQAAVAQGMSLPQAEAAVAAQLQIPIASLYNNYTTSPAGDNAALAALAPSIVATFQAGTPVLVSAPAATVVDYKVRSLAFTNGSNYTLRYYYAPTEPAGNGLYARSTTCARASVGAQPSRRTLCTTRRC
jgi:hypothetical protein